MLRGQKAHCQIQQLSKAKNCQCVLDLCRAGLSPFCFFKHQVLLCLVVWGGRFRRPWDPSTQEIYHHSGHSPIRPNELWTGPDTEPPGLAPGCQRRKLLGPFEELEEGISTTSRDVIKVQGEDPASPGYKLSKGGQGEEARQRFSIVGVYPLGLLVKNRRDRNDSPIFVKYNKVTHSRL